MAYADRTRADSFGSNAELYDHARPSYPAEMINMLLAGDPDGPEAAPRHILDVGCGTGIATRLLMSPDRDVLGLEPDARMAALATQHGIPVEVATFETWDPVGRRFDLITSAQAWHWVDPVAGARKAAEVLRPGKRFAAFWNQMRHTPDVLAVCGKIYERHAPHLWSNSVALGSPTTVDRRVDPAITALRAARFTILDHTRQRAYARTVDYSPEAWIELLSTHSDHQTLDPVTRAALLGELREALERLGPRFSVDFHTDLILATRDGTE
jgi:SAM-dependent methyltransferase